MADNISYQYPDEFASNFEKDQLEFGKTIGKLIYGEWYQSGRLTEWQEWVQEMRSYARGEQCTKKYKTLIEGEKKTKSKFKAKSYKIDYVALKIMPSFMDVVLNPIDESLFKPRAEAIDETSVNNKNTFLKDLEEQYYLKEFTKIQSQGLGIDLTNKDIPETEEKLRIKKLEYKPLIEMAQELAISKVMTSERFEVIKDAINPDLFALGIGIGRHYTDKTEGIKLKYVDPYNYMYNRFQMEDGRDIRYNAVEEKATISEIIKQAGGLDKDQMKKLKMYAQGITNEEYAEDYNADDDKDLLITYYTFSYLLSKKTVYKKHTINGSTNFIDRSNDEEEYNPKRKDRKVSIPYQTWYEGVYIPVADIMLKWEQVPNQIVDGINIPISNFVVYAPKVKKLTEEGSIRFDSMVNRAKPFIDSLHIDYYKYSQLKAELRPNTVTVSPRLLNKTLFNGKRVDSLELLDMYFGRGVLLADEFDEDGERMGRAITENGGGINNSALGFLKDEFKAHYMEIRQVMGINELRDGTTKPNSKTAVSVQKILFASSNNQTSHIVKGSFNIYLDFAKAISLRLYDVFTTKALKNRYYDLLGNENADLLSAIKDNPMSKFAIYFDFKPDNYERLTFEQSVLDAYYKGDINVAQYNKVRLIQNTKNGGKYLENIIKENEEEEQIKKIQNIKAQAEANSRQSVLTEQTKQQTLTIKSEIETKALYIKAQIKSEEDKRRFLSDELKAKANHQRALELKQLELNIKTSIESDKEDRKDEREDQRALNQAKLIDKRKKDIPVTFENQINSIFQPLELPQ